MRDHKFKKGNYVFVTDRIKVYQRKYNLPDDINLLVNQRVLLEEYIEEINNPFHKPSWKLQGIEFIIPEDCLVLIPYNNLYKKIVFNKDDVKELINVCQLIDVLKNNLACDDGYNFIKWMINQFKTETVSFDDIVAKLHTFDRKDWYSWFFEHYRREHPEKIFFKDCIWDDDTYIIGFLNKSHINRLYQITLTKEFLWSSFINNQIENYNTYDTIYTAIDSALINNSNTQFLYFENFENLINWYNSL